MNRLCPKCGGVLKKQFLNGSVVWCCGGCSRGYPEYLLKAVEAEVDMTLRMGDLE